MPRFDFECPKCKEQKLNVTVPHDKIETCTRCGTEMKKIWLPDSAPKLHGFDNLGRSMNVKSKGE